MVSIQTVCVSSFDFFMTLKRSSEPEGAPSLTAQAMIGDQLIKYSRGAFGMRKDKRFFWIDPSSRILLWNRSEPDSESYSSSKTKEGTFAILKMFD